MRILFLGDIVGDTGCLAVKKNLSKIKSENKIDFTVVNAENSFATGVGISENAVNKIFKPGYTTKKSGWGLGLSLVERIIVNFHKGRVIIKETKVGKGTTFEISLNKKLNH